MLCNSVATEYGRATSKWIDLLGSFGRTGVATADAGSLKDVVLLIVIMILARCR